MTNYETFILLEVANIDAITGGFNFQNALDKWVYIGEWYGDESQFMEITLTDNSSYNLFC
jgi:hypothetical protein